MVEPWVSAWAWVHHVVVGFSGFCSLGFGARRGGWAWVDGVVVGRVWVFGGGAVGLGLGLGSPRGGWVFWVLQLGFRVVGLGLTAWWLEGFGFLVMEPWVSA